VSHGDSLQFWQQLREAIIQNYDVDRTRFYFSGQSAGSFLSQSFAVAFPEFFAAIASTSGAPSNNFNGTNVNIEGTTYPASNKMVPNYMIYGEGDLSTLLGTLWDATTNALDRWAGYFLGVNGLALTAADEGRAVISGWQGRFITWTWTKQFGNATVPVFQVTKNIYRSHNNIYSETPMLWEFARHYSSEVDANNNVVRYFSPSGFEVKGDKVQIYP
jgi:poly(3-hydroxybutyrate) depolymerase